MHRSNSFRRKIRRWFHDPRFRDQRKYTFALLLTILVGLILSQGLILLSSSNLIFVGVLILIIIILFVVWTFINER